MNRVLDQEPDGRVYWRTDAVYVTPSGGYFWSPDGIGRYWYDSVEDAREDSLYDLPETITLAKDADAYDIG